MAKDRRTKTTAVGGGKKKKKQGRRVLLIALVVFFVLFAVLAVLVIKALLSTSGSQDTSDSDVNVYESTPDELKRKQAYYVIGLSGADETASTEMLCIACYDKKKETLNILEVPQDTYLGKSDLWACEKAGDVWGNPAPLDWCDFEGKRIYAAEVQTHIDAGHTVSKRKGSASYNLISVFNEELSLPVDGYFMIPQEGFVKLVDLLGGLDVNLESTMKVDSVTYNKGVRTLDGRAALQYVLTRSDGTKGDIDRLVRQRKVMLALFARLTAQNETGLNDTLALVMKGSTPIRTQMSTDDLIQLVLDLKNVKPENVTSQIVPGEATKSGSTAFYSLYRAQLVKQLNAYFNPYGDEITEADVAVTELAVGSGADVHLQKMSSIVVKQSGTVVTEASTATTKKAS